MRSPPSLLQSADRRLRHLRRHRHRLLLRRRLRHRRPAVHRARSQISIGDDFFDPANIGVPVGATVCWTNNGQITHTATSDTGVFDSGFLAPGESFVFTFGSSDVYPVPLQSPTGRR